MSFPLRFRVWVCGGQKTISSEHVPSGAWAHDGHPFVMSRSPATWSSLCSVAACRVTGGEYSLVSPRWFARDGGGEDCLEKVHLEASIVIGDPRGAPSVSLAALDALISGEFPGVPQEKITVEAQWSCSESGPSLGLLPRRALGAVLRLTGPADEPDGYREIPPA